MICDVCVIGAGPAGLMAAIRAAQGGAATIVFDSNTNAGQKLLRTGRGRCNITHLAKPGEILKSYDQYEIFLRHAIYEFGPDALVRYFNEHGVPTKVEKGGGVWPVSDRATDVNNALVKDALDAGVRFLYAKRVEKIERTDDGFAAYYGEVAVASRRLIIATGGVSWPFTGSRGDGYEFAARLGHKIIAPKAALVPLVTLEAWPGELAGTPMGNITISAKIEGRKVQARGDALFTHHGIGGPGVFDFSRLITDVLFETKKPVAIAIDFLPDVKAEELAARIDRLCETRPRQALLTILAQFVPKAAAEILCREFNFDAAVQMGQMSKARRRELAGILKSLPLSIKEMRPIAEATVTRGGVANNEIDPKTMESKICPGLYFAGEVIDVDGPCGGYNLQIAFSTGALAGCVAAASLNQ